METAINNFFQNLEFLSLSKAKSIMKKFEGSIVVALNITKTYDCFLNPLSKRSEMVEKVFGELPVSSKLFKFPL